MGSDTFLRPVAALLLAVTAFATTPAYAEKPEGKSNGKSHKEAEKARKHDEKRADKADKHERKAQEREDKQARKSDRRDLRVGGTFEERHREFARSYYTQHYGDARGCPPGLAKKNNGCMPPGQAKKYRMGQPLPREVVYYPVPQPVLVQLPVVPVGYRYVRVGNDILLLSPQSTLVIDVIVNIFG